MLFPLRRLLFIALHLFIGMESFVSAGKDEGAVLPRSYLTGAENDKAGEPAFGLLLMGGGPENDEAMTWLLEKASGGDVLVLRASGSDGYNDYFFREIGGVNSVRSIVFQSREEAFHPKVAQWIRDAELIFIAGGDQARYFRFWKGTPVQALLNEHLKLGKPLGGTSAGLAILGRVAYAAYGESILSGEALSDLSSPNLTLEEGFLQVPFLSNIITDSHFSERGRLGRLLAFQAVGKQLMGSAALIGLGLDEEVALAVEQDGSTKVFQNRAEGRVTLTFLEALGEGGFPRSGPLDGAEATVFMLDRDSHLNLASWHIDRPRTQASIQVVDGKIVHPDNRN